MTYRIKNGKRNQPAPHNVVAVVGMGLSLPGASSADEFWSNIIAGKRFFQPASVLDWGAEPEKFVKAGKPSTDKAYSINGAFNHKRTAQLDSLKLPKDFDPKSADSSLLFWLKAGLQARAQVKWQDVNPSKVGVISGHVILPTSAMAEAAASLYSREASRDWPTPPDFGQPPALAFRLLGYSARLLGEALGFSGPAYTIDAACASSLYAIHLAVEDLLSGKLEAVISGGVAKADALFTQLGFSQLRALSHGGSLNSFDENADGLVVGEGAVALILKRLDKALADGDHIRALIRGAGLSNDQTGNILAPQAEGQLRAMRAAWDKAGLDPSDAGLIEAHGTGTILGDRVEVETLKELLSHGEKKRDAKAPVLGSVKSSIGHLLSAAGAASMAKVILAIENKTLPPSAGFEKEAPGLNLAEDPPLRILCKAEQWDDPPNGQARLAAVNAFGFGGVNAQVIIEEWRPDLWKDDNKTTGAAPRLFKQVPEPVRLLSARALSAPWPDFASLAQNWMDSEGPPIIVTRRFGHLKATGLFFNSLVLEGSKLRLAPKDLAHLLPQQAMALKMADESMADANLISIPGCQVIRGINASEDVPGVDKTRVGVFMGVDVDPRSADYAFRWLGPMRAAEALVASGQLNARDVDEFVAELREKSHPPLSASRVVGALGSLVASRVARFLGTGGPAFTVAQGNVSGLRALKLAMEAINRGDIDMAMVGMVDTVGDPKTAALEPKRLWEEGAAMLIVSSAEAAAALGRPQAPEIEELVDFNGRIGGLGGLFPLVKNAFYIRHRLASRGLGAGAAYWIKNKQDPSRRLECPGFAITEKGGEEVTSPPYSYDDATWFLIRSHNKQDSIALLERLESMAAYSMKNHSLEGLGPVRSEKRALKRLGDRFWAEYGHASGAKPALAILARNFDDLLNLAKKAKAKLKGQQIDLPHEQKTRILWALEGERLRGEMAWVFPGSGSHYPGLGRKLAMRFPHIMGKLEKGVSRLADHFQSSVFWGPNYKEVDTIAGILGQVSFGLLGSSVLKEFKLNPQAVIGYSLGEVTGLLATGAWADREALYNDLLNSPLFLHELGGELSAIRKQLKWPDGKYLRWVMGLVPRSSNAVRKALNSLNAQQRERAFLLLSNTYNESVIGGEEGAVRALSASLGAVMCPIEGAAAVHTPLVKAVADKYKLFHTRPTTHPEGIRFYSAAWGRSYDLTSENVANSLTEQAVNGHDFPKLIEQAYADGVRYFVEIGPGATASRMINDILRGRPHLASSLSPNANEEGWLGANRLLVELWLAGWPMKMSVLFPDFASSEAIKLPVPITLSPEAGLWPEPREVLKSIEAKRQKQQATHAVDAGDSSREAEISDAHKKSVPQNQLNDGDNAFRQWLAEAKKEKEHKAASIKSESPAPLSRAQCLEFATGTIAAVLGERFKEVDNYPSRVRLPDEPLMFVDRVLNIEGKALSMSAGRIVTEHDILPDAWYLDQGHIPTGLAIESGQADLMLSAWLGADFATKGMALYRLLDAEVTFHRAFLPKTGETVRYDIRIVRFFKYGQTHLFRFEFDAFINGQPLLSMKNGCAGFFTPSELSSGRGLPGGGLIDEAPPSFIDPDTISSMNLPATMDKEDLEALRKGDLEKAFHRPAPPGLKRPLTIPAGRLALIDRVVNMEKNGGRYGCGFIRAEMDVDPQAWFLTSHFVGDEVMPGTLMYESCLYTMRTFLLACGWVGEADEVDWQPVAGLAATLKCRGQVTASTKTAAYEIHIRRLEFIAPYKGAEPEPCAVAEAIMLADNRPIVEVRNMHLRLAGFTRERLKEALRPPSSSTSLKRRIRGKEHFDKKKLLALAAGRPSEALGQAYARFDHGEFVARLPRPPYDLIDEAAIINGQAYNVETGSQVEAVFTAKQDSWLFTQAGGHKPHLPYAALNEVALQPCGFLAAYMGSALPFSGPMHFRNLGGEAVVTGEALPGVPIHTSAKLIKSSRMGEMLIQHFEFSCKSHGRPIYEGITHFGFFNPQSLANQAGLNGEKAPQWSLPESSFQPYPKGLAWPGEMLRMIDEISISENGGPNALGSALARTKVNPSAWFFDAHFYQDPVWPGSLGLEAFIQAAKAIAYHKFGKNLPYENIHWQCPALEAPHQWLYRGQITRDKKEMAIYINVVAQDEKLGSLTADGILLVDNLPIYKMSGFRVRLIERKTSGTVTKTIEKNTAINIGSNKGPNIFSADDILNWRTEHGISQGQLAKLMGVTSIYISLMERGKRNISPLMAEKLALIFSGQLASPNDAPEQVAQILSKGTMKSRREEKEAAAKLLTPEQMRQMRTSKGISQKKLADQVGVTATLIGLIELGKRGLSLELARKILAVLEG